MARSAKFTEQMPFVGTPDQFRLMGLVEARLNDSKAAVIRAGLNLLFGLEDDVLPEGADEAAIVERALAVVKRTENYEVCDRQPTTGLRPEYARDGAREASDDLENTLLA